MVGRLPIATVVHLSHALSSTLLRQHGLLDEARFALPLLEHANCILDRSPGLESTHLHARFLPYSTSYRAFTARICLLSLLFLVSSTASSPMYSFTIFRSRQWPTFNITGSAIGASGAATAHHIISGFSSLRLLCEPGASCALYCP